jgi:hypothetical protein
MQEPTLSVAAGEGDDSRTLNRFLIENIASSLMSVGAISAILLRSGSVWPDLQEISERRRIGLENPTAQL